jgi:hypothetical protein
MMREPEIYFWGGPAMAGGKEPEMILREPELDA